MTTYQQLQGWPRAKALGDICRHLASAYNDNGQVNILVYDWQRDLLADELIRIETIEAAHFSDLVLNENLSRQPPQSSGEPSK